MAILEAMYYDDVVVTLRAPGPKLIIEDKVTGFLCENEENLIQCAVEADKSKIGQNAHKEIVENFLWKKSMEKMLEIIRQEK